MIPRSDGSRKSINYTRVVDLSHLVHPGIPQWPGDPAVDFETVTEIDRDGYYLRRFSLGEHSGAHLNAPSSFHRNGLNIDAYPAESLIVPAVVVDVRDRAAANPDYVLTRDDVLEWERKFGQIASGSILLLYTGWQGKWNNPKEFLGQDDAGSLHFPGFGLAATRFLLEQRSISGIGIDTHGVDGGQDDTFAINRLMLEQPRIVLECLTNLNQLPPIGTTLVIGILRLKGGSGSPVSALALVP
jgi:kynurenine formamidase